MLVQLLYYRFLRLHHKCGHIVQRLADHPVQDNSKVSSKLTLVINPILLNLKSIEHIRSHELYWLEGDGITFGKELKSDPRSSFE
jgi:hypothetical protein